MITVGIGAASFVLSFAALADLAARAGIPAHLAWLWPLIVDGTILQVTMAVVALAGHDDEDRKRRYFWIVLSSSAAVSVGANGLHAMVKGPLTPWLAAATAVVTGDARYPNRPNSRFPDEIDLLASGLEAHGDDGLDGSLRFDD
jgi:Protein of unknown function (DUF2637)